MSTPSRPVGPNDEQITVAFKLDDRATLCISGDQLWWENVTGNGFSDGDGDISPTTFTIISDGIARNVITINPTFPHDGFETGGVNGNSNRFTGLFPPFLQGERVKLDKPVLQSGRGEIDGVEYPSKGNNFILKVSIYDPQPGSGDYVVGIHAYIDEDHAT
jgi:hypothetical protein